MEVLRKWVQALFALVVNSSWSFPVTRTIYQGPLKAVCSPGLNCYSCPAASLACPLGALQQLLANLRLSLDTGQLYIGWYVLGFMGMLGAFFGRLVCGWMCPFGFLQELLHKIPSPKYGVPRPLRFMKYGVLALMVVLLPFFALDAYGAGKPWFCEFLCPAGTLEAGIPMLLLQPALRENLGLIFYNKLFWMTFYLAWSVPASRPFCITACPLGAFYALFARVKFVRLAFHESHCTRCGACHQVCPMGVKFNESPDDAECISCLRCMHEACRYGAISVELGGLPLTARETAHRAKPEVSG